MSRLAQLLTRFRLPLETTSAELRKAYYREAKLLHPDRNPSSSGAQAFAQLRADFEEAQKLLEEPQRGPPHPSDGPDFSFEDGKRWSAASWAARSQAPPNFRGFRECPESRPEPAVPVVGLPHEVVYTFTAVVSGVILFGFLYHLSQELSPPRRYCQHAVLLQHANGRSPQLRVALENFSKAEGVAAAPTPFAAQAAHRAAAANEVGWLEHCGTDKACRPLLFAGDERDDTPLHHGARAGRTEAVSALIRLGADPARLNRFGLAPEHLAAQLGHKDTAFVLRSVRTVRDGAGDPAAQAAAKRAMRHPDDLGHFVQEPQALSPTAVQSLRCAAKMTGDPEQALCSVREWEPEVVPVARERAWVESWAQAAVQGQRGLLVYEMLSGGGPGHWIALVSEECGLLRLDPRRGMRAPQIQAGIDAIAGFLSKSRQLRILWSPPYFSRLWCVFEIAAYRKVNPRGGLVFAPMFLERTVLLIVFGSFIMAGFFWIVDANNYDPRVKGVCVAINPLILLVHLLRSNARDKTTLLQDLERFDLENVHCSLEADREFVMAAIDRWYGSPKAFTEYVRGPLRQELLKSATKFSTTYIFLMTAPAICAALEDHLALWKARVPVRTAAAHFVAVVLGDYTLWMSFCMRMLIALCFYFDAKCRWKIIDYLLTIFIHVIFCGTAFAGELIGAEASRRGLWTACAFMVFAGALLVGITRLTWGVCRA